jgi:hypothetical protein
MPAQPPLVKLGRHDERVNWAGRGGERLHLAPVRHIAAKRLSVGAGFLKLLRQPLGRALVDQQ